MKITRYIGRYTHQRFLLENLPIECIVIHKLFIRDAQNKKELTLIQVSVKAHVQIINLQKAVGCFMKNIGFSINVWSRMNINLMN